MNESEQISVSCCEGHPHDALQADELHRKGFCGLPSKIIKTGEEGGSYVTLT